MLYIDYKIKILSLTIFYSSLGLIVELGDRVCVCVCVCERERERERERRDCHFTDISTLTLKLKGKNSKTGYFHTFQALVINRVVCQFAIILKLKVKIKSNTNS